MEPAPSPKPRQKPKILATQCYIFSVNALATQRLCHEWFGEFNRKRRWSKMAKEKAGRVIIHGGECEQD